MSILDSLSTGTSASGHSWAITAATDCLFCLDYRDVCSWMPYGPEDTSESVRQRIEACLAMRDAELDVDELDALIGMEV